MNGTMEAGLMDVRDVMMDQFLSETGRNSKGGRLVNQETVRFRDWGNQAMAGRHLSRGLQRMTRWNPV